MQINEGVLQNIGEFTYRFLRFERCLVDRDFFKANGRGYMYPDFEAYFNKVLAHTDFGQLSNDAFPEMIKPLSKRLSLKNKIDWKVIVPQSNSPLDLIIKLDVIRDNLFHGSKVLHDERRDILLLEEGITILKLIGASDYEYQKYL
jgi:hypothetical protein